MVYRIGLSGSSRNSVLSMVFPFDVETCPTGQLRIDGQDGSAISFKEGVSVRQTAEDFSWMFAKMDLVLSQVQSMLSCTLNGHRMREQRAEPVLRDGNVRGRYRTVRPAHG